MVPRQWKLKDFWQSKVVRRLELGKTSFENSTSSIDFPPEYWCIMLVSLTHCHLLCVKALLELLTKVLFSLGLKVLCSLESKGQHSDCLFCYKQPVREQNDSAENVNEGGMILYVATVYRSSSSVTPCCTVFNKVFFWKILDWTNFMPASSYVKYTCCHNVNSVLLFFQVNSPC